MIGPQTAGNAADAPFRALTCFAAATLALPEMVWGMHADDHLRSLSNAGSQPASSGRLMGSTGRHQADSRWPRVLARHRWRAVFGIGAGTAALAGAVVIALPSHSPISGAGACGRATCAGTLAPFRVTARPHGSDPARRAKPRGLPSAMPQVASTAMPRTRTSVGPSPAPARARGHGHGHPTRPRPSHPAKPTPTSYG